MKQFFKTTTLGSIVLTLVIAGTLHAAGNREQERGDRGIRRGQPAHAPARANAPVKDNPGARQRWMDEWYNENYGQSGRQAKQRLYRNGLWTPEYMRFMMEAAKQERTKYRSKMPSSSFSSVVLDPRAPIMARAPGTSLSRDLRWTNIGPTRANFQTNGGITLNVMDSGRVRTILTDPNNPNTLYVAFAGGGLWRSLDGGAFWQAMTETLGSLSVGALAMDPNNAGTLYLGLGDPFDGTGLGVVKMTDRGEKWAEPVLLGDSTNIRDLLVPASNSSIVLAATNRGLYRSTNAGRTFDRVVVDATNATVPGVWSLTQGAPTVTAVNGVNTNTHSIVLSLEAAPDAASPNSRMGQVWRSTDSGATWTRAIGVTHANGINRISIAAAPSNRNVMYAMAAKTGGGAADLANIFRSTDGGANWAAIATNAQGAYLQYTNPVASNDPAKPDKNIEYRTVERLLGGQGWYNHMIVVDPDDASTAFFGGALQMVRARPVNNVFQFTRMTDWLAQNGMPYVHADIHAGHFARNPNQDPANASDDWALYVGTDGGIFRSVNGGTAFTHALNEGIASHLVYNVCSSPNNPQRVLIGLQDNGTRLRVLDAQGNGTSVFNQVLGGDGFACDVNRSNANNMIGSIQFLQLRRSTDGGTTFGSGCTGIPECGSKTAADTAPFNTRLTSWKGDANGNTLFTYNNTRVYRTTNYGADWTVLGASGLPVTNLLIRSIDVARNSGAVPNNDNVIGIITKAGRIFLTNSRGAQTTVGGVTTDGWAQAGALPSNNSSLSSITFDPTDRNIIYVTSVAPSATAAHVWRSTDFGRTWAIIDGTGTLNGNGFPRGIPVNSISVDHIVRTTLYAATHLGVYRSIDSGTNWERFGAWMPLVNVTDVQVSDNGNTARAATFGRSVWEMSDITNNAAPVANFNTSTSGLTASFTNTSTDSDGTIARTIWNFGDGISSSTNSPNHTYAQPGTYTVTLTVTDNGGLSHTRTAQVTVNNTANAAPTANFTFTTSALTATFTDSSGDSDGTIASRSWNFGDSTTSTATSPNHTYAAAGTYTVTLTVTDNSGASHNVSKSVTVTVTSAAANTLSNGVPVNGITLAAKATKTWTMTVPAGATNLKFVTSGGTGDADLYGKFGSAPTDSDNDCASSGNTSAETCSIPTAQAGTYHVMVLAFDAVSGVTLTGSYSVAGATTQLLLNPGFESGAASWTATAGVITNGTSKTPRTGSWYAWLGGTGATSTKSLSQAVAIPSGKASATLSFHLKVDTAETTTSSQYDKLSVQVLNSAGTVLKTCATYSNLDKGTAYVQKTCDLTAYIGQTVTVKYTGTEDSTLQTSFVIDDTALNVQ